ncbi:ATPase [Micromonosporaceae bacterium DT194]|uniref:ATPase n=1 Tax=Melissospora conviva TaxID=3388432 RepID=UPI003C169ABB
MRFSVVPLGYDRRQVESCLQDLETRLADLAGRAGTEAGPELVCQEIDRVRGLLSGAPALPPVSPAQVLSEARTQAGELLAQARTELAAAYEEARLVRERAYAEAVQARREFEAALHARRLRELRVDGILREVSFGGGDGVSPVVPVTPGAHRVPTDTISLSMDEA